MLCGAVNITDLKKNLSRYLNEVRRGAEVLIKDRNTPIARIVPLAEQEDDEGELIAAGCARLPKSANPLPKYFWSEPLPKTSLDLIDLLREDRDAP
ncbi:MAG: type II toxin-antitoxin system prevent-host-death family antitoxin [Blastocatellia bacterium]